MDEKTAAHTALQESLLNRVEVVIAAEMDQKVAAHGGAMDEKIAEHREMVGTIESTIQQGLDDMAAKREAVSCTAHSSVLRANAA